MRRSCVEHLSETLRHKQRSGGCCWQQSFRTKCECLSSSRAKPRFTAKVVQDQEHEELSEEWKRSEAVVRASQNFQFNLDETPTYQTRLQRKAAPAGTNPYFAQGRGMQIPCLQSVVNWDLSDNRVAREAAEQMEGETLIWDHLGRSGRASHPTSQHYRRSASHIQRE